MLDETRAAYWAIPGHLYNGVIYILLKSEGLDKLYIHLVQFIILTIVKMLCSDNKMRLNAIGKKSEKHAPCELEQMQCHGRRLLEIVTYGKSHFIHDIMYEYLHS